VIGVGSVDWFRCPSFRTRTCGSPAYGSPAYGSPVGGFTSKRTDGPRHGVSRKLRGSRWAPSASVSSRPAVRPALTSVRDLSGGFSREAMWSVSFGMDRTSRLHLPAPFAPPALPGLSATMSALTPARRRDTEARSAPRGGRYVESFLLLRHAGLLASRVSVPQEPSVSNNPLPPMTALAPSPSAGLPVRTAIGFAFRPQARQSAGPNRVCFRYGRLCCLPLLPTRLAATPLRSATGRRRLT